MASSLDPSLLEQLATRHRVVGGFTFSGMLLPNPDPVLRKLGKSIQVYRDLRSDATVGGLIRRRKAAVKALEWGIDKGKAKSRAQGLVEEVFAQLDLNRIVGEILDASLFGFQPMEILWESDGRRIVPADVLGKPSEWFSFDDQNNLVFRSLHSGGQGEPVPPRKFLLPRQDPTYDNPHGFADLSMVFWPATFKHGGLQFWVQFAEKYGAPWVIGKHPRGSTEAETEALADRLEAAVQDAILVIPDDASVEIIDAKGGDKADAFERLLMHCRSEISIALVGQNQTTEAESNRASATAGQEVAAEIRDADSKMVERTLNEMIRWIHELNVGDGLPPTFSMWEQKEVDKTQSERDKNLKAAGAVFTPQYFQRVYSLQDGDLAPAAAPPSASPGASVAFAERDGGAADSYPDQAALDGAVEKHLTPEVLQGQMEALLQPVFAALEQGADEAEILALLGEAAPKMDDKALIQTLTRVMFAADLVGRLTAQEELKDPHS